MKKTKRRYDRVAAIAWGARLCQEIDVNTYAQGELSREKKIDLALFVIEQICARREYIDDDQREELEQYAILCALMAKLKSAYCYGQQVCYLYKYVRSRVAHVMKRERLRRRRCKNFADLNEDDLRGKLVDLEYEKQIEKNDDDYYLDQVRNALATDNQRQIFDRLRQSWKLNLSEIAMERGVSRQAVNYTWQSICKYAQESIQYLG